METVIETEKAMCSRMEVRLDQSYSISRLIEAFHDGTIYDYVLQRDKDQYTTLHKSLLIDSALRGLDIPAVVVAQMGTGIAAKRYLIDGGQRCSIFEEYINDGFAMSHNKKIEPITIRVPAMENKVDENGNVIMVAQSGKKKLIPAQVQKRDEDGNLLFEYQPYDLRGKKFSMLPKELQKRIKNYSGMHVKFLVNCTAKEIRTQMERYNLGSKMNVAQIGEILSGEILARYKRKMRNHNLFKNQSTWTDNEKKKDAIERCVTEAFVLCYCPDVWKGSNYNNIVTGFCDYASDEMLETFKDLIDDLSETLKDVDVKENLTSKNLYMIVSLYNEFLRMDYNKKCFADFLVQWFKEIKDTTNYNDYDEKSTRSKANVVARSTIMQEALEEYLGAHGYGRNVPSVDETNNDESVCDPVDFDDTVDYSSIDAMDNIMISGLNLTPAEQREFKIKAMMLTSSYNAFNFDKEDMSRFFEYYSDLSDSQQMDLIEETDFMLDCVHTYLSEIPANSPFITVDNILCLVDTIQFANREDVPDVVFKSWLVDFVKHLQFNHRWNDLPTEGEGYMMGKISFLQQKLMAYHGYKLNNNKERKSA